jgi:hypothetical protein
MLDNAPQGQLLIIINHHAHCLCPNLPYTPKLNLHQQENISNKN